MFCILHAYGDDLQDDRFLNEIALPHCKVLHKGESVFLNETHIIVTVSEKEDFADQIEDALAFLRSHQDEVKKLLNYPGVEEVSINFSVYPNQPLPADEIFPSELYEMALNRGISLNILEQVRRTR